MYDSIVIGLSYYKIQVAFHLGILLHQKTETLLNTGPLIDNFFMYYIF